MLCRICGRGWQLRLSGNEFTKGQEGIFERCKRASKAFIMNAQVIVVAAYSRLPKILGISARWTAGAVWPESHGLRLCTIAQTTAWAVDQLGSLATSAR